MERNFEQEAFDSTCVIEDTSYMYPEWNRAGEPPDDENASTIAASEEGYATEMGAALMAEMTDAEIAELGAERDAWLQDQRYMQSDIERGEY